MTRIYRPTVYATPEEAMRAAYNNETAAGYNQWKGGKAGRQWTYDQFNGRGVPTAEIQRQMRAYYDSSVAPQWDEYVYDAEQQPGGGYVGKRLPPGQRRSPPAPPVYAGGVYGAPDGGRLVRPGQPGFGTVRPSTFRPVTPTPSFAPTPGPTGAPRPRPIPAGTPGMGNTPPPSRPTGGGARMPQVGRAYSRY